MSCGVFSADEAAATAQIMFPWQKIADLPQTPEPGDYVIWLKGWGVRHARWISERGGAWLVDASIVHRSHASHYAFVSRPDDLD